MCMGGKADGVCGLAVVCCLALALCHALHVPASPIGRAEAFKAATAVEPGLSIGEDMGCEPYYVFIRGRGRGYVVAAGDDCAPPILAVVDTGYYEPERMPQFLKDWYAALSGAAALTDETRAARSKAPVSGYKEGWGDIAPMTTTKWSQYAPYNSLCPIDAYGGRSLAGCLATACAQAIYYFRRDAAGQLSYDTPVYAGSGAPVEVSYPKGTPIGYDLMADSATGDADRDGAMALLTFAVGASAGQAYGPATVGPPMKAAEVLDRQFQLSNRLVSKEYRTFKEWETLIYSNLATGRPVLDFGSDSYGTGHAAVIDGYQASTGLYHFNMGWGGKYDGYYPVDEYYGVFGFGRGQRAIVDITPKRKRLSAEILPCVLEEGEEGTVAVSVANGGTLPQYGFRLYCDYGDGPQPVAEDSSAVLLADAESVVEFRFTPSEHGRAELSVGDRSGGIVTKNPAIVEIAAMSETPTGVESPLSGVSNGCEYYDTAGRRIPGRTRGVDIVRKGGKAWKVLRK